MIYLVDVRVIVYNSTINKLNDNIRSYIVKANNRNQCEDKINRLIESYHLLDTSIVNILRIRQALLDNNDIGEIT